MCGWSEDYDKRDAKKDAKRYKRRSVKRDVKRDKRSSGKREHVVRTMLEDGRWKDNWHETDDVDY